MAVPASSLEQREAPAVQPGTSRGIEPGGMKVSMNHNEQLLRKAALYGMILLAAVFAAILWKG